MDTAHQPPRLGAFWPYTPTNLDEVLRWVELVNAGPYGRLWTGQSSVVDTTGAVAYAAGAGYRCSIGLGVQIIPMHNPVSTAQHIRVLSHAARAEVQVCFSPGDPAVQAAFTGRRYRSPLTATREFIAAVRALLDGTPGDPDGDYFPLGAQMPAAPLSSPVSIGIGVLRERMAELAGQVADTAVTWLTPPRYIHDVVAPALRGGAAAADRSVPHLVVPVHAALAAPNRDPRAITKRAIGTHLGLRHYQEMFASAGLGPAIQASRGIDAAVDGALEEGVLTYGSTHDIADRVAQVIAAGADEVPLVLHQPNQGWSSTRDEWLDVGRAVTARLSSVTPLRTLAAADRPATGSRSKEPA